MQFKVKNWFEHKSEKSMLNRYKSILAILFFCGFNFKVFKFFNRFKILSNLYCSILVIITTTATIYCFNEFNYLQLWSLFEYISSASILIIYNSNLSEFSSKLTQIDTYLRINYRYYCKSKKKIFLMILMVWFLRISFITIHCLCYTCITNLSIFLLSIFSSFALDMNRIWRFLLLDIIRNRLSLLRERMEEIPDCKYYLYAYNNKTFKEDKIKFCLNIYRSLADISDQIAPEIHASMFASIVCSVPKLIINVYHILLVVEDREPIESIGFLIMHMFQVCFLLFSPCIIVELHSVEVEKIKKFLVHRLIDDTDPRTKEDIEVFLTYTKIRSFQYKIWRFIPLNVSLPIEIANMCTSSIIVIINFTHLYG